MKNKIVSSLVVITGVFGIFTNAYCLTVGVPEAETHKGQFSVAVEQEYMFGRDLKGEDVQSVVPFVSGDAVSGDLHEAGSIQYKMKDLDRTMVNVGYQMTNNLNVYAKFGISNTNGDSVFAAENSGTWAKQNHPSVPENFGSYKTVTDKDIDNAMLGALGLKLSVPVGECTNLGFDAQYLTQRSDYGKKVSGQVFDNNGNIIPQYATSENINTVNTGKATISEWHIASSISKTVGKFVYYSGLKYSDFMLQTEDRNMYAKNNLGAFLGANVMLSKTMSLKIEGRFIDETAVTLGLTCFLPIKALEPTVMQSYRELLIEISPESVTLKSVSERDFANRKSSSTINPSNSTVQITDKAKDIVSKIGLETCKIKFDFKKVDIRDQDVAILKRVAKMIKELEPSKVRIEGHSDNLGKADINAALSQKRAEAVKNSLIAEGIDAKKLEAIGFGGTQPIADNKTRKGRSENRRVEFAFTFMNELAPTAGAAAPVAAKSQATTNFLALVAAAKAEKIKDEALKAAEVKVEESKAEQVKVEAPKVEQVKAEDSKDEPVKAKKSNMQELTAENSIVG